MKHIKPSKLHLSAERLRTLTTAQLEKLAGGIVTGTSLQACTSVLPGCASMFC